MSQVTEEEIAEAADDLLGAADYLQETLENGDDVYESKWIGGFMRAHGLLRSLETELSTARASIACIAALEARLAQLESVLAEAKRECIMTPFCAAKIVATDAAQENGK